jgi:hypothetical protein
MNERLLTCPVCGKQHPVRYSGWGFPVIACPAMVDVPGLRIPGLLILPLRSGDTARIATESPTAVDPQRPTERGSSSPPGA